MDSSIQLPNHISTDPRQGEEYLKTLAEIIALAPTLRFFNELSFVGILFFGLMQLHTSYEFPPSIILAPTLAYTLLQVWRNCSAFKSPNTPDDKSLHLFSTIDWISVGLFQVMYERKHRFFLLLNFMLRK